MQSVKKRLWMILLALFLPVFFVCPAVAANAAEPRLVDQAGLLSDSEEAKLLEKLNDISERQQADLVVVTQKSRHGTSAREYADDFYDRNGYGFGEEKDGILFLISMEERDWYISTSGFGITALTDADINEMSKRFTDDLSAGEYAAAFTKFANLCDDYLTQARKGAEPFPYVGALVLSLGVGFAASLAVTGMMRSRLKTVRRQASADGYVKNGSMKLATEKDLFLYRQVTRMEKPKQPDSEGASIHAGGSSTHQSSSGASHGGGGGKF